MLNYVEAMNEMEGTYTDDVHNVTVSRNTAEMVKYFNMIRYRAGLPGITEADASDKAKMRELIKRERQVEFALEGRRFFDLRRWGDLASTMASPFTVLNVDARSNEQQKFYTRTISSYQYYSTTSPTRCACILSSRHISTRMPSLTKTQAGRSKKNILKT